MSFCLCYLSPQNLPNFESDPVMDVWRLGDTANNCAAGVYDKLVRCMEFLKVTLAILFGFSLLLATYHVVNDGKGGLDRSTRSLRNDNPSEFWLGVGIRYGVSLCWFVSLMIFN